MVPRMIRRQLSPSWLLTALGNSWFAVGPAFVLVLFDDHSPAARWGILPLALAAQFACDFGACAVRERFYGRRSIRELLEEVRPIYAIDLALSCLGLAVAFTTIATHSQFSVLLIAPLFVLLRFFSRERHERLEQLTDLNDAYQGTALLLGDVVEADDAYTGQHCKGVVRLALDVSEELGLDADLKRKVEFGALLHDVGKIAVPKEIINKPGKLDEREWAIIKTHTIEGQRMLEKIGGFMREIGGIVRASHERWDGGGYPDGLSGEDIPIEARIVSTCDAYSAMTTTRSYRKAMPLADALAELEQCAGSHFDPTVVDALLRVVSPALDPAGHEPDREPVDELVGVALQADPALAIVASAAPPVPRRRPAAKPRSTSRRTASSSARP
jgi:putative nucleotidyltransferase with HDIG domain